MKVLQTITTPTQRIPAGTELPEDVILDGPLSRADWQRTGHLEAPAVAPASDDAGLVIAGPARRARQALEASEA